MSEIPPLWLHSFLKVVSYVKTKTVFSIKLLLLTDAAKVHLLLFKMPLKQSRCVAGEGGACIPCPGGEGRGCLPQRPWLRRLGFATCLRPALGLHRGSSCMQGQDWTHRKCESAWGRTTRGCVMRCPFSHTCLALLWPPQFAPAPVTANCLITSHIWHHVSLARCKLLWDQEELRSSRVPHWAVGGPQQLSLTHWTSGWHWGEAFFCHLFMWLLPLGAELSLPVNFSFFPINYPSQRKFLPQHRLFLLVLSNMYKHEISTLSILGKYPCISNVFGEDEVHLRLWFKAVFVRNEIGKRWSKEKAKSEIHTDQWFSLKNKQLSAF